MKTKTKTKKEFDAVEYMRDQRQRLSEKLSKMTKKEIIEYFRNIRLENKVRPSSL